MPATQNLPSAKPPPRRAAFVVRHAVALISAALALTIALATLGLALRFNSDRVLSEPFTFSSTEILGFPDKFLQRGWVILPPGYRDIFDPDGVRRRGALALEPGAEGLLSYCLFFDPGEEISVTVRVRNDAEVKTILAVAPPDTEHTTLPVGLGVPSDPFVTQTTDLTPYTKDTHYCYFVVHSFRASDTDQASWTPVVTRVDFQFSSRPFPAVHPLSCLFFTLLCFLVWWLALGFILPAAIGAGLIFLRLLRRGAMGTALALFCVAVAAWCSLQPEWAPPDQKNASSRFQCLQSWSRPKSHDDLWALGNTNLLALRRFHTEDLFFRSRVRPGFLAFALPLQTALPHHLAVVSVTPSDAYQRLFYIFDRTGMSWNCRIYPEMSLIAFLTAVIGLALVARLAFVLDAGRAALWRAAAAAAFAAWFWARALQTPLVSVLSLSITWTVQLAAVLAFLEAIRAPRNPRNWILAGGIAGIGILFKESALAFLVPVVLFQAYRFAALPSERKPLLIGSAVYWLAAAVLPIAYFGLVLDGGFAEILKNFRGHLESEEILQHFEKRGIYGTSRALWMVFGWGLLPVLVGLTARLRNTGATRSPSAMSRFSRLDRAGAAAVFFLFWIIGGATAFTLPYFYPRFLVDMIPAMAWFAADGTRVVFQFFLRCRCAGSFSLPQP